MNSTSLLNQVGITGIPDIPTVASVPDFEINGLQRTGGLNTTKQQSKVIQLLDDLTWVKGKNTFKFGGDVRRLTDHDENVFGNYRRDNICSIPPARSAPPSAILMSSFCWDTRIT